MSGNRYVLRRRVPEEAVPGRVEGEQGAVRCGIHQTWASGGFHGCQENHRGHREAVDGNEQAHTEVIHGLWHQRIVRILPPHKLDLKFARYRKDPVGKITIELARES